MDKSTIPQVPISRDLSLDAIGKMVNQLDQFSRKSSTAEESSEQVTARVAAPIKSKFAPRPHQNRQTKFYKNK